MFQALTEFDKKSRKKIRNYRITHDISQEEIVKYLELSKQAISRIENGKRRITPEYLISAFGIHPWNAHRSKKTKYNQKYY